ncbi:MAG TPA: class I SAM-dependent methyltransferase, partial [Candidatus Kapabacteria bacterium]|nr:class I SAM-dependent methyltransferase [Candidatus Kapabacteria bacterium]
GANARFLAQRGLHCTGWDISQVALDQLARWRGDDGAQVYTQLRDVEAEPPAPASFDVIVVSDFLHRPLCNALSAALRPGGLLFYQTWCADKCATAGPSNPDFLLQTNELPSLFTGLEIRFYQHFSRAGDLTLGDRDRACLVAQQPG